LSIKVKDRPSSKDSIEDIDRNLLLNCSITQDNILNAEDIFGPQEKQQGKDKCTWFSRQSIPNKIIKRNKNVVLAVDVIVVNKICNDHVMQYTLWYYWTNQGQKTVIII